MGNDTNNDIVKFLGRSLLFKRRTNETVAVFVFNQKQECFLANVALLQPH